MSALMMFWAQEHTKDSYELTEPANPAHFPGHIITAGYDNEADVARYHELGKRVGPDYDGSWWNNDTLEMAELEERATKQGMGFVNRDNAYTLELTKQIRPGQERGLISR